MGFFHWIRSHGSIKRKKKKKKRKTLPDLWNELISPSVLLDVRLGFFRHSGALSRGRVENPEENLRKMLPEEFLEGNWKKLGSRDSWEQAHYRPGVMMIIKEYEMAQEHMKNPNRKAKEKRSSRVTKPVATSRNYERRARQKRNKGCENDAKWNLIKVEGKWPTVLSWNNKREWIWLRVSFISLVSGCSQ